MQSDPAQVYGKLLEGAHIAGYSLERAMGSLEWLLAENNRWRKVGGGFSDVNAFIASIRLGDDFKIVTETRKRIAARIKQLQPAASNRAIAKAVGVDEGTIRKGAENSARKGQKRESDQSGGAENSAPISGAAAARSIARKENAKNERSERVKADEARIAQLVPIEGKFRALVIDPPWDYEWLSIAGRAKPGYAMMPHDELLAFDVARWAEENCHLYCWTTNNFMTRAVELVARWGFQHKTVLTWIKPRIGLGSYFRNSTEHVLFAVRGELRTRRDDIPTHFEAPVGEHSAKPEKFYDVVRAASHGPFGEIFQRTPRDDFSNLFKLLEAVDA